MTINHQYVTELQTLSFIWDIKHHAPHPQWPPEVWSPWISPVALFPPLWCSGRPFLQPPSLSAYLCIYLTDKQLSWVPIRWLIWLFHRLEKPLGCFCSLQCVGSLSICTGCGICECEHWVLLHSISFDLRIMRVQANSYQIQVPLQMWNNCQSVVVSLWSRCAVYKRKVVLLSRSLWT